MEGSSPTGPEAQNISTIKTGGFPSIIEEQKDFGGLRWHEFRTAVHACVALQADTHDPKNAQAFSALRYM